MHEPSPHRWQAWRHTWSADGDDDTNTLDALRNRMALPFQFAQLPKATPALAAPADLRAEAPGPDGIRHGLVAYYQQLIADGELDTPERWDAAEDKLFDRIFSDC